MQKHTHHAVSLPGPSYLHASTHVEIYRSSNDSGERAWAILFQPAGGLRVDFYTTRAGMVLLRDAINAQLAYDETENKVLGETQP